MRRGRRVLDEGIEDGLDVDGILGRNVKVWESVYVFYGEGKYVDTGDDPVTVFNDVGDVEKEVGSKGGCKLRGCFAKPAVLSTTPMLGSEGDVENGSGGQDVMHRGI